MGLYLVFFGRIPSRMTRLFNSIKIKEAIYLAENCKIETTGQSHIGGIYLTLIDGSKKFLEDKYETVNYSKVYSDDYNHFFQLLHNSKTKCGFQVQSFIE